MLCRKQSPPQKLFLSVRLCGSKLMHFCRHRPTKFALDYEMHPVNSDGGGGSPSLNPPLGKRVHCVFAHEIDIGPSVD